MVAQLIKQADGSYEYVEAMAARKTEPLPSINLLSQVSTEAAKSLPVTDEFEAYEGVKKGGDELVSAPSITEQTEKITREIPGQVVFDEKTGQFITKKAKTIDLEYKPGKVTPESTELTSLQKVMSMQPMAGTGDAGLERAYSLIEQRQKLQEQQQKFQQYTQLAQVGMDAYSLVTGKDLGLKKLLSPIKFKGSSLTSMPIGTRGTTLGGAGTAGMLGYGVSGLLGGKPRQQKGAGVGSAIGMVAGGPIGAVIGGAIGHVIGCFSQDTPITMTDGATKSIIDIDLKDKIAVGGFVFALGKFLINDLYDYKGIKVSGSHMVNEEGIWKEVKDTKYGKSLGNNEHVVYTLGAEHRRILINNILFTDYFEVEEKDKIHEIGNEYFDNWRDHGVILNKENKRILNAI